MPLSLNRKIMGAGSAAILFTLAMLPSSCSQQAEASPSGKQAHIAPGSAAFDQAVSDAIMRNPEMIQDALDALDKKRMQALQLQLEAVPEEFTYGNPDAPITIVEFYDYRCGYCKAAMDWVLATADAHDDVRVVFREYPILSEASLNAAQASVAASEQGKFLAFHKNLMSSRGKLSDKEIDDLARKSGIDVAKMRKRMKDPRVTRALRENMLLGDQANVSGTPAFFINGQFLSGYDPGILTAAVEKARGELKR